METLNTLFEQRSTQRPWWRKYRAASQGSSPIRVSNVRTMSSAPEATSNKAGWHVTSKHSSAAPTPALARWCYRYHAYIITLCKYHGHKGRGTTTARPECGSTALRGSLFRRFILYIYIYTFRTQLSGRPVRQYTRRTHDATARERTSRVECSGGLYNKLNTRFT